MSNNLVISAVVRLVDQVTAPLRGVTASIDKLGSTLGQSAAGLARWGIGLTGVAGAAAAFNKVVSATVEAEKAVMQFDIAFKALGKNVGQTREQLLAFADEAGSRTIFDDESIIRAQTALLRFRSVTGDTFVRARAVALDLASAMGTDLAGAANAVGRSLERPSMALRMLRQYGIVFSRDQEILIRQLEKTGDRAGAAAIILRELEGRFKGASDVAANTLGGSLARLRNAFDNLFEAADDGEKLTKSVSDLADTVSDPNFKRAMTDLAAVALDIASAFAQAVSWLGKLGDKLGDLIARRQGLDPATIGRSPVENALAEERKKLQDLEAEERRVTERRNARRVALLRRGERVPTNEKIESEDAERSRQIEVTRRLVAALEKQADAQRKLNELTGVTVTGTRKGGPAGATGVVGTGKAGDPFPMLQEVIVSASKTVVSATQSLYDAWDDETSTTIQKQVKQYEALIAKINELAAAGRINPADAEARRREVAEAALQEVELTSRRVTEGPYFDSARESFKSFANTVGDSLANAISQGGFEGMTTLRDILRNTLRGILADILSSGIKNALMSLFDVFKGADGGGGGGGFWGFLRDVGARVITSFFTKGAPAPGPGVNFSGPRAGGGPVTALGPVLVGEEGPEMFWPNTSGRIMSAPALAGMGASVNYSPQTSIVVYGNALDEKTKEELLAYIDLGRARDQRHLSRIVTQNGLRGAR